MFEHLRFKWFDMQFNEILETDLALTPWIHMTVYSLTVGEFANDNDQDDAFARLSDIMEEFSDFLKPKGYLDAHHMDKTERGRALKKKLEEYIDWLLEMRKKYAERALGGVC